MSYTHLSPEERYYIEISLKNEIGLAEIAASLERPQSTISREISRNTGRSWLDKDDVNWKRLNPYSLRTWIILIFQFLTIRYFKTES